jgi:hypothetical protein
MKRSRAFFEAQRGRQSLGEIDCCSAWHPVDPGLLPVRIKARHRFFATLELRRARFVFVDCVAPHA